VKSSKSEEISVFESLPHVSRRKFAKRVIIGALGSSILLESLPAPWGDASPLSAVAFGAQLPVRNITDRAWA
jgi:hypothetical protein